MARILVVEDEGMVAEVVEQYLLRDSHSVRVVRDGISALQAHREEPAELLILDIMLPGLDGFEVCRRVRKDGDIPVIILSARREEADRLQGLSLGADDYVTKPFSPRELAARVQAVLRRAAPPSHRQFLLTAGGLWMDSSTHVATWFGKPLDLTAREWELLAFLARNPNHVFSRDELVSHVWGADFEGEEHTVTVHMRRLREKLEPEPSKPRYLRTVWGVGYTFAP